MKYCPDCGWRGEVAVECCPSCKSVAEPDSFRLPAEDPDLDTTGVTPREIPNDPNYEDVICNMFPMVSKMAIDFMQACPARRQEILARINDMQAAYNALPPDGSKEEKVQHEYYSKIAHYVLRVCDDGVDPYAPVWIRDRMLTNVPCQPE